MNIIYGTVDQPFFEVNPEFKYIKEFVDLIKKEGEERAGLLLWCFYLVYSSKSQWVLESFDTRVKNVENHYLQASLDLDKYEKYISKFKEVTKGPSEKSFDNWREELENMDKAISKIPWKEDKIESKQKYLAAKEKLWKNLRDAEVLLDEEKKDTRTQGNTVLSSLETGSLFKYNP